MKTCPHCRQKIDYIAIKTITTKINYFGGVFRDEEIKEEVKIVCPKCDQIIYQLDGREGKKISELAKEAWLSL